MFHCVTKCDTNKYYYEEGTIFTKRKCYEECPDFTKPKVDFIYECDFYKLNEANSLEQLRDYANIQVREGYGLTECVTGSCLTPLHYYREGSIGIPYPDTYYKIVEPQTEKELTYGQEGEIVISGPTVMHGYLKSRKETKETLRKHKDGRIWLHTGDQGLMDKDGFVYFKNKSFKK